jgi:REP element-mobilizing transposase RayT
MGHTFTNLLVHITFSTKERAACIKGDMGPKLFAYMGGILREQGATPLLVNGPADHVHLLMVLPATQSLSDVMRVLKTNSSKWAHETWPDRVTFGWQEGYGAFSVSESRRAAVLEYIQKQEEHHRKMTFQEEFVSLLKKHGIEYDERYIWA